MSDSRVKMTIYFDPRVKKILKQMSMEQNTSISEIINNYFEDILLDREEMAVIKQRRSEDSIDFYSVLVGEGLTYDDLRG